MQKLFSIVFAVLLSFCLISTQRTETQEPFTTAAGNPAEGSIEPFLDKPAFDTKKLFDGGRFPNVVVGVDGTVLATWGAKQYRVRRSEDGGDSWGSNIQITGGVHAGGVTVDETTGKIFVFVEDSHPPAPHTVYVSSDAGANWREHEVTIKPDKKGNTPALHMAEHGITLRHGPNAGRLLRPARVFGKSDGYNTTLYSDDHGRTWHASEPFPMMGTGEGAIAELSNGDLYYSSRKHWFEDVADFTHQRSFAWSDDGGETWEDPGFDTELPDGPRYRGKEGRGSNYNGHFGMMCGLVRLPVENRDVLLYSNADTPDHKRKQITVWASFDGGTTWPVKRRVHDGPGAYSSLAAGRPGTASEGWVYLLFEGGDNHKYDGGLLARFNLSWLLNGTRTGDGDVPEWATK